MVEKISIVTDEISQDLDEVTRFLDEHDIRAIEIRTMGGKRVPYIDPKIWDELKNRVDVEGWNVIALSPGTFKGYHGDEDRTWSDIARLLETKFRAYEVNAGSIITFGFMAENVREIPDNVLFSLHMVSENFAPGSGLPLLLENEPGSFAQTGESVRALIDAVDNPNLFANWDPCNSNVFDNPELLSKGARALGDKIKHVHVKDGSPNPDSDFAIYGPISTGHTGWKRHLEVLKEIGYKGYLGIETHYEPL